MITLAGEESSGSNIITVYQFEYIRHISSRSGISQYDPNAGQCIHHAVCTSLHITRYANAFSSVRLTFIHTPFSSPESAASVLLNSATSL